MLEATLLEDVPPDQDLVCLEAFGPVAVLSRFSDFDAALEQVNDSAFGLQAGIFTRDIYKAMRAWDRLEVGGVVIGDVPLHLIPQRSGVPRRCANQQDYQVAVVLFGQPGPGGQRCHGARGAVEEHDYGLSEPGAGA